jgi:sigma-B regulation protein RsbU (phosphoserine phosphatase)
MTNENTAFTNLQFGIPASEIAAILRCLPPFDETDLAALTKLVGRGRLLALHPGEVLLAQGEASDAAYIIIEGSASIRIETSYGTVNLSTISAPALVGEIGVFMGVPRTATIDATKLVRALRIDSGDLQKFGSENPRFLARVMTQVGNRFRTFNEAIGFYSNALQALRQRDFDLRLIEELRAPLPELVDFTDSFRRLAEEIVERRTHLEEMASAAAIQRIILPSSALRPSGGPALNLFAHTLPARNIGGDFYDYFLLEDRRLAITVGDVSGKGIPAALFMAAVQTALRLALKQQQTLDAAIAAANDLLVANNDEAMFATLFCALIDIRSGVGVVCNCGHPAPFVLHRGGDCDRIGSSSLPLGLQLDAHFKTETITMRNDDMIFLWTDGLSDALNPAGERYGERRLEQLVFGLSTENAKDFVLAATGEITEYTADATQFDDLTALAFVYDRNVGLDFGIKNAATHHGSR